MINFTNILSVCLVVIIAKPTGVASSCDPPNLPKYSVQVESRQLNYPDNTNIHYKCLDGFSFDDQKKQHKIGCIKGTWLPKLIECKDKCSINGNTCSKNGNCTVILDKDGAEKPICSCEKGFAGPTCSARVCDTPSTPKHGSYQKTFGPHEGFPSGTKIKYRCKPGYSIKKGNTEATCQESYNHIGWYPSEVPQCLEDTCPELHVDNLVTYSPMKTSYKSGATVTVRCHSGYKLNWAPSGNTWRCLYGRWNPSVMPSCTRLTCSSEKPFHGKELTKGPYGVRKQATYECNAGYIMVGDSVRNCIDKGNGKAGWNEDLPICLTHVQYQNHCALLKQKIVQRSGKYSCEPQSSTRPLIIYSSKSNSTKPLTIVTATAGGLLLLLLLLITLVAIQRRRLARSGGRRNRSRSRDDRYAFLYYSNDFHLVLPSYDEAIQGRRSQPPPYTSDPASTTTSTTNTGNITGATEPNGATGIENPLAVSDIDEPPYETVGEVLRERINQHHEANENMTSVNMASASENQVSVDTNAPQNQPNIVEDNDRNLDPSTNEPLYASINRNIVTSGTSKTAGSDGDAGNGEGDANGGNNTVNNYETSSDDRASLDDSFDDADNVPLL